MDNKELSASLRGWVNEFNSMFPEDKVTINQRFCKFLANRLIESGGISESEDDNTVIANIGNGERRISITGVRAGFLAYEIADGSVGTGLIKRSDIRSSDYPKLTKILGQLESEGKI